MKVKVTYDQFKEIFKSKNNDLSLTKHLAKELFNDPDHPISKVDDFELKKHLFKYIEIVVKSPKH